MWVHSHSVVLQFVLIFVFFLNGGCKDEVVWDKDSVIHFIRQDRIGKGCTYDKYMITLK